MLNRSKLDLILTVQDYAKFKRHEARMLEKDLRVYDWYKDTEKFYNDIPQEILDKSEYRKNTVSFENILFYKVTDEIMSCEEKDLGKFD